jgi:hypothetical protein
MFTLLATLALAQSTYSLDDIVLATRRGLSPGALATIAEGGAPWTLSHEEVVTLLRTGVSTEVISIMTEGREPTADALAAAKQPGPSYQPKPPAPVPAPAPETPQNGLTGGSGSGPLEWQLIEEAPGSADELYSRARRWFSTSFVNADAVLDLEDAAGHHLIGKGSEPFSQSFLMSSGATSGAVRYVVSVDTKDGRYRARVGSFEHRAYGSSAGFAVHFGLLNGRVDPGKDQCATPAYCVSEEWRIRVWGDLKTLADRVARSLLGSLKTAIAAGGEGAKDDDW